MNGVDIGTLAGRIEFEDKTTATMTAILDKVTRLESSLGLLDTGVRATAQGFIIAEVAIMAMEKALDVGLQVIQDFTTEGAAIADVEDNFNNLAESAGRAGDTMLGVLREGTHNTINDFELMKTVNDQFAAGVQLTDEQMRTLAEGGFALAQSKGMDVAQAFETLNQAMLTGNARAVRSLVGQIDMAKAQDDYAAKLGTTSERLTTLEKQEAGRVAILEAVSEATARLGTQSDGVDEIIAQMGTAWDNFYNGLIKNVAASPQVVRAFLTVKDAIFESLGGSAEAIMDNFMSVVNSVADNVTQHAPTVIGWFVKVKDFAVDLWGGAVDAWERFGPFIVESFTTIKDWIINIYDSVISTWDALPDWMKRVAERSALTAAGLVLVSQGVGAASSGLVDLGGSVASFVSGVKDLPDLLRNVNFGFSQMAVMWAVMDFSSITQTVASFKLLAGSIAGTIGPLGVAAVYAAALYAAYELGKWEPVSDFFMELGLELQGFSQAEQDAMIAADKATQAAAAQTKEQSAQVQVLETLNAVQEAMRETTDGVTAAITDQGGAITETTDRTKEYKLAWDALNQLGTTYEETLKGVSEELRASVLEYAALGATVEDLFEAFPKLTKAQAEAAVASAEAAKEIRKVNMETFDIISAAHGDNINDWIEGEQKKLAATLESLKIQGKLTDDMLNAQMAKFDATIDAEISKRNEANEFTRDYYEKQLDDAQNAHDLIMQDTTRYTDHEIRESFRALEEKKRNLEHWKSLAGDALAEQTRETETETDKQADAVGTVNDAWSLGGSAVSAVATEVRKLTGDVEALAEQMTFTNDIPKLTKTELKHLRGMRGTDEAIWAKLDELEDREGTYAPRSAEQYTQMINDQVLLAQLRMWAKENERQTEQEVVATIQRGTESKMMEVAPKAAAASKGLSVSATFNMHGGSSQDQARQVFGHLMDMVKTSRQFGTV